MGDRVIHLFLTLALAQDPPPADASVEIEVWGEVAIRDKRAEISRELRDMGWRKVKEADGRVIYRPPKAWMGRATLAYDGTLQFRKPVLALQSARAANPVEPGPNPHFDRDPGGLAYPTDDGQGAYALPHPEGTFWLMPGWSVVGPAHQRVRDRLDPLLDDYRAIVERTATRAETE